MKEIYCLIGELIQIFQKIEENLALLMYCHNIHQPNISEKTRDLAIHKWATMSQSTFGKKLKDIEELKLFEEKNDIIVLDYIKTKRNYIAHSFFLDNDFKSESDIYKKTAELIQLKKDSIMIQKALKLILNNFIKNNPSINK